MLLCLIAREWRLQRGVIRIALEVVGQLNCIVL